MDANGRERYAHEAELELGEGVAPAAVGAQVTVALCGHWEHEGPCRWPHNNQVEGGRLRTLFVAAPGDEVEVRGRIEAALRADDRWTVRSSGGRPVAVDEQGLAERLAETPLPPPAV